MQIAASGARPKRSSASKVIVVGHNWLWRKLLELKYLNLREVGEETKVGAELGKVDHIYAGDIIRVSRVDPCLQLQQCARSGTE